MANGVRRALAGLGLAAALAGCSQEAAETTPAKKGMDAMAMGDPASPYAQANARMHAAMTQPDDVDPGRNFAKKMSAHHQGAVEMAEIALREVQDPEMRALAQKIIADQKRELAQMQAYLDRTAPRAN